MEKKQTNADFKQDVFEHIKQYLEDDGVIYSNEKVSTDSNIRNDLFLDSFDIVSLASNLEDKYLIDIIEDVYMEKWETVDDIIATVCKLVETKNSSEC